MTPLTVYERQIFAPITVGDLEGYAFVDTGANQSTFVQAYARSFEALEPHLSHGAFGAFSLEQCLVPAVDFAGQRYTDVQVYVQAALNLTLPPALSPILARIGEDVLAKAPLFLNFSRSRLDIGAFPKGRVPKQKIPFNRRNKLRTFELELSGLKLPCLKLPCLKLPCLKLPCLKLPCLFDTGAALSVLNARYVEAAPQLEKLEPLEIGDSSNEKRFLDVYRHPAISAGGEPLGEARFLAIDLSHLEEAVGYEIGAVYGFEAMRSHDWLLEWDEALWRY